MSPKAPSRTVPDGAQISTVPRADRILAFAVMLRKAGERADHWRGPSSAQEVSRHGPIVTMTVTLGGWCTESTSGRLVRVGERRQRIIDSFQSLPSGDSSPQRPFR